MMLVMSRKTIFWGGVDGGLNTQGTCVPPPCVSPTVLKRLLKDTFNCTDPKLLALIENGNKSAILQ